MAAASPQATPAPQADGPGGEGTGAGREQCWICSDKAVSVRFKPCQHATCENCVNKMRREVVLKADKGLTCPYCRGFVKEYDWIGPEGVPGSKAALREANTAAKAAAAARSAPAKPRQPAANGNGHAAQPSAAAVSGWVCTRCRTRNASSQRACVAAGCLGAAPDYVHEHLSATALAVQRADRLTIHKWAAMKLHPNLNPAFEAAGMPFDFHRASLQGTKASVMDAMVAGGHKVLQIVFDNVLGCDFVAELAFAFFGSYTLQDLLQAAKRLRIASTALHAEGRLTPQQAAEAAGGKPGADYLGRLVAEIAPISVRAMGCVQGKFVMKKALAVGEAAEAAALAQLGFANAARHLQDTTAAQLCYMFVPRLRDAASSSQPDEAAAGQASLDLFCSSFVQTGAVQHIPRLLCHASRGQLILDAIQGSLPGPSASRLLQAIGAAAPQISKAASGLTALKLSMDIQPRNAEAAEELVTHVCVVAQALEARMADMAADGAEGTALVRRMLRSLAGAGDGDETCREWTAYITERLVGAAERVSVQPAARSLLALALARSSDEALAGHVQEVHTRLGAAGMRALVAELSTGARDRIAQHLAPQPPAAADPPQPAPAPAPPSPAAAAPAPVPQAKAAPLPPPPAAPSAPAPPSPARASQGDGLAFMSDLLPPLPPVQQQPLQQPQPAGLPAPVPPPAMACPPAPLPQAGFPILSFPARFGPPVPAHHPPPPPPAGCSMPLPAHRPPDGYALPHPGYQPPGLPAGFGSPRPPHQPPPPAAYANGPPGQQQAPPSFLLPAARPPPGLPQAQAPFPAQAQPPPRAAASSAPPPAAMAAPGAPPPAATPASSVSPRPGVRAPPTAPPPAVSQRPILSQPAPAPVAAARAAPPGCPPARPPSPARAEERPQAWAQPAPGQGQPWACAVCTYRHEGAQASFLACDMCGSLRP